MATLRNLEIPGIAVFKPGAGDLLELSITTSTAEARIYLHGAHVRHFQPAGERPVMFLSAPANSRRRKRSAAGCRSSSRGSARTRPRASLPTHGFARTTPWEVESLAMDGNQVVIALFCLESNDETRALWPHDFCLRHRVGRRQGSSHDPRSREPIGRAVQI